MASKRSQASANPTLTNYAQGHAQDLNNTLAAFLCPEVVVASTIGQFKKYDSKNAFMKYATERAIGGTARRIEFLATDGSYNCPPHALEIAVDDAERDAANDMDPLQLDQSKIMTLLSARAVSHEYDVFTAIAAAVSAVGGGTGVWGVDTNDPVDEIDAQIEAITIATGMMPNRIAMSISAWRRFRNNALVKARQPGATNIGLTMDQAAAMLLNPNIQIRVGTMSYDSTKPGKTRNVANIMGEDCYIYIASDAPTVYDPGFAKCFRGARGGVMGVRTYRDESARSDVHAIDWSRDIQIVSSLAVKRITTADS